MILKYRFNIHFHKTLEERCCELKLKINDRIKGKQEYSFISVINRLQVIYVKLQLKLSHIS